MQREIQCAYHQGQSITNFCDESKCLMPLCPKCLSIHSQEHKKNKTYGSFHSIDDTIQRVTMSIKKKIETFKKLQTKNEKTTQNSSDLNLTLTRKLKEAKDKILFEIDSFFNALENKAQKLCQELSVKMSSSLRSETTDLEKKIRQQQEYLEGIQKKDKCLMSLIRALKSDQQDKSNGSNLGQSLHFNSDNDILSSDQNGSLLKKIQLKVDLEKLTEITDSLAGYAKLIQHQTKKQVTFDKNDRSNNSASSSVESRPSPQKKDENLESPSQDQFKKAKKNGNQIYNQEDDDKSDENEEREEEVEQTIENKNAPVNRDADDIYLINDPDIIRLRQRREERRIRAELREIGMKKSSSSITSPKNTRQVQNINPKADKKSKKVSIEVSHNQEKSEEPSSSNFITFERPSKDQLRMFAKPEELQFLDMVQQKSLKMQQEFEKQQNDIYVNAMSYKIPISGQRPYQPRNFADQQQQLQSQSEIQQPMMNNLKNMSYSQPGIEISSPHIKQNLQQQYHAQQFDQRPPLSDILEQNNYNQQGPIQNNGYENRMTSHDKFAATNQPINQLNSPNKSINNSVKYDKFNNEHSYQKVQQWPSYNSYVN